MTALLKKIKANSHKIDKLITLHRQAIESLEGIRCAYKVSDLKSAITAYINICENGYGAGKALAWIIRPIMEK